MSLLSAADEAVQDIADLATMEVALAGGVALMLGLALIPLSQRAARALFPVAEGEVRAFGLADVLGVAGFFLLCQIAVGVALGSLGVREPGIMLALAVTAVVQGLPCLLVLVRARSLPHGMAALGLRRGLTTPALMLGLVRYVLALPVIFGLMLVWPFVLDRVFGYEIEPQAVAEGIANAKGVARVVVPVFAILVVPLLEELLFRGFMQPVLVSHLGAFLGVVLTSAVFAILHGTSAFLPIFGLSLVLGVTALRSQRLVGAWFVHALHNGLTTGLLYANPDALGVDGLLAFLS